MKGLGFLKWRSVGNGRREYKHDKGGLIRNDMCPNTVFSPGVLRFGFGRDVPPRLSRPTLDPYTNTNFSRKCDPFFIYIPIGRIVGQILSKVARLLQYFL